MLIFDACNLCLGYDLTNNDGAGEKALQVRSKLMNNVIDGKLQCILATAELLLLCSEDNCYAACSLLANAKCLIDHPTVRPTRSAHKNLVSLFHV